MTLGRRVLKKVYSPVKSPKVANSSLKKKVLIKRLSSGAGVQFGSSSKANLKVVVRVRPENQREVDSNARSVIDLVDDHMLIFDPSHDEEDFFFQGNKQKFRDLNKKTHKEQKFIFERVFHPHSTNGEVFDTTTKDIIDTILSGYNCSVFAYGATGSGKTHTMIGKEDSPGIIFLTVMELYKKIKEIEDDKTCEVAVSYLEVYNEMVRDLLQPGKPLNLHETGHHVQVTGLSLHKPKDAEHLLRILAEGNLNRSQHPTDANAESSRSHAVFQVFVRQQDRSSNLKSSVSIAKLSMIDLAGSERGAVTGFKGARFREGASINKSLLALGNCINALADGKGHIPYRDSKLTRLLKDSLGGNCRSVMVATITKSSLSFEDTFNTLRYANRAKTIKTTLKKNLVNVDQHVSQYLKVVEDLKSELSLLKEQLKAYESSEKTKATQPPHEGDLPNEERKMYEETIQKLREELEEARASKNRKSDVDNDFIRNLNDLNCQLKSYQRENLQLETKEKELVIKIYIQRLLMVRMNVFAFASKKLEKGISKSQRSIQSFQNEIEHIQKRKEILQNKLAQTKESVLLLFKSHFNSDVDGDSTPDFLIQKLRQYEIEQGFRDCHQIKAYLQEAVRDLLNDQANSEKLLLLLLITVKNLFLKLKVLGQCDAETEDFLQKIFRMMDSSRIEWADLKNTNESFGEQTLAQHIKLEPLIDVKSLTEFPNAQLIALTPVVNDIARVYKRSNIKRSPNGLSMQHHETSVNSALKLNSNPMATPCSYRTVSPHRLTPIYQENENGFNLEDVDPSFPAQAVENKENLEISGVFELNETDVLQPSHCTKDPSTTLSEPILASSITDSQTVKFGSPEKNLTDCSQKSNLLNSTITLSGPDSTDTLSGPKSRVENGLNETITLASEPDFCYSLPNSSPSLLQSPAHSQAAVNTTITISHILTKDPLESISESERPVHYSVSPNVTFSFSPPTDDKNLSTSKVVNCSPKSDLNPPKVLQPLPSSIFSSNSENVGQPKPSFKRPALSSSKMSFTKLPPNVIRSSQKGFKRCLSVPSLHGPSSASKIKGFENTMKRSISFAKPKFCSASKDQENHPPKSSGSSVAFGSRFSKSPKNRELKRALNFNGLKPPEQ